MEQRILEVLLILALTQKNKNSTKNFKFEEASITLWL